MRMGKFGVLGEIARRDAPPLADSNLRAIQSSLSDDETPIAIAMVGRVWFDGVKMDVAPKPIGIFESRPAPIIVLTNRFLHFYLVGSQKGLKYVAGDVHVTKRSLDIDSLIGEEKTGIGSYVLSFSEGTEVLIKFGVLSDRRVRQGVDHLQILLRDRLNRSM